MSTFEFTISMILGIDLVNSFGSEEKAIFSCQGQGTKRQSSFQTFNSSRLRISSPLLHCINQPPSIGSFSNCQQASTAVGTSIDAGAVTLSTYLGFSEENNEQNEMRIVAQKPQPQAGT